MTTRITGLYSGLDVDALVEAGVSYQQNKVDKAKQNEQKLEWQQAQYRTIQSSVQDFYTKYLSTTGEDSLMMSSNWNTNSYTSSDSSKVAVSSTSDAAIDSYSVSVTQLASAATGTLATTTDYSNGLNIYINGSTTPIEIKASDITTAVGSTTGTDRQKAIASLINSKISNSGASATYSELSGGIVLKTTALGGDTSFSVTDDSTSPASISLKDSSGKTTTTPVKGTYLNATITNSSGTSYTLGDSNTGGTTYSNTAYKSNSLTLDGVTFNFTGKTDSPVTITGTKDVSDVQDKIESFMDDYNTLMKTINGKIYESYDNNYQPLTDSQKSSMTDDQVTKWETKAQVGLLRNDSYLEKLADDMKSAMSSFFKSSGIDIESIGIKAVDDYSTKNGTYTVDSDKLKSALEGKTTKTIGTTTKTIAFDDIKNLFTNGNSSITSFSTKNSDTDGILSKLKVALNINATMSSSELAKRAGIEGTTSETTNEITQLLKDQNDQLTTLEEQLSDKEDALYSKYSKLETSLSSIQSSSSIFSSSSS